MADLPDDLVVHIFCSLRVLESLPVRLVCRKWRALYERTRNKIVSIVDKGTLSTYTLQTGERFCLEFRKAIYTHPLNNRGCMTFLPRYSELQGPVRPGAGSSFTDVLRGEHELPSAGLASAAAFDVPKRA